MYLGSSVIMYYLDISICTIQTTRIVWCEMCVRCIWCLTPEEVSFSTNNDTCLILLSKDIWIGIFNNQECTWRHVRPTWLEQWTECLRSCSRIGFRRSSQPVTPLSCTFKTVLLFCSKRCTCSPPGKLLTSGSSVVLAGPFPCAVYCLCLYRRQ